MTQPSDKGSESGVWKTRIAIGVGFLVLVVPAATILVMSDAEFRAFCKARCKPYELTYRVVTTGARTTVGEVTYPADCYCIHPDKRTVVEKLRDLVW